MQVTLYKNTIFTNRYSTVFDCKKRYWQNSDQGITPFEKYLGECYQKTFTISNAYVQESGVITVNLDEEAFEYNYLKFEFDDATLIPRYCFIDTIELGNKAAQLHYTLDIWHTYSDVMRVKNGVLGRARLALNDTKRALPVAYETSKELEFVPNDLFTDFYLAAEISEYEIDNDANKVAMRNNYTCLLGYQTDTFEYTADELSQGGFPIPDGNNANIDKAFRPVWADTIINQFTGYQGMQRDNGISISDVVDDSAAFLPGTTKTISDVILTYSYKYGNSGNKKNITYEINQVYAIPRTFTKTGDLWLLGVNDAPQLRIRIPYQVWKSSNSKNFAVYYNDINCYRINPNLIYPVAEETITIDKDATIVGYGLKDMFIPMSSNNTERQYKFVVGVNNYGLSLSLRTEEGLIDLGPHFEVPLPFTTLSGAERQQAAIAKQQAKIQLATTIGVLGTQIATGIAGIASGTAAFKSNVANAALNNYYSKSGLTNVKPGLQEKMYNAAYGALPWSATAANAAKDIGALSMTGLYGSQQIIGAANAIRSPINATSGNNTTPNALINALIGFGYYEIEPNNQAAVTNAINLIGYSVYIPTDDYHRGIATDVLRSGGDDPIQFLECEVYGPFSQAIARALEDLLMSGFRIIYDA